MMRNGENLNLMMQNFLRYLFGTMQAGLSWSTILRKRENMRKAFDKFDYKIIAQYDDEKKRVFWKMKDYS